MLNTCENKLSHLCWRFSEVSHAILMLNVHFHTCIKPNDYFVYLYIYKFPGRVFLSILKTEAHFKIWIRMQKPKSYTYNNITLIDALIKCMVSIFLHVSTWATLPFTYAACNPPMCTHSLLMYAHNPPTYTRSSPMYVLSYTAHTWPHADRKCTHTTCSCAHANHQCMHAARPYTRATR